MKQYLYGAGAAVVAVLIAAVTYLTKVSREARDQTIKARQRVQGERDARKHVQEATEATNEVDDDIRGMSDSDIDRELREYARDKDAGN